MGRVVLTFFVSFLVCQLVVMVVAQDEVNYVAEHCEGENFNYTIGSVFDNNLKLVVSELIFKSLSDMFYNYTLGDGSNQVYGIFQCRVDIHQDLCSKCVAAVAEYVYSECRCNGEAITWYEECMVRYSNRDIFSLSAEMSPFLSRGQGDNVTNAAEYRPFLETTMTELIGNASSTSKHFAGGITNWTKSKRLYSFAQCTPDIVDAECYKCLKSALFEWTRCCAESEGAMVFMPSCQLRYDTKGPFLNELPMHDQSPAQPPPPIKQGTSKKSSIKPAIIGAIGAGVLVGLLVLVVVLWICVCRKKPKESRDVIHASPTKGEEDSLGDTEFVQYDFATLKTATRNFSAESKLGQGGFGAVYKGTLENKDQLAIKRLSGSSGQGTMEFMAEARLLAKLQHKNLVKLVGFCSEGDEKLLVYEFMPNGSLDGLLFDSSRRPLLDWVIRSKIIMGIARGLQYLHEDSRLTIIHRDLKPGNILLDKEMNPKIADFGLAKLFEVAQKFGNTSRIAGTMGYMAPEYMETGEYSDKSDVYSFGIMLLEIVSGQNNSKFYKSQYKEDLPVYVWRLWNAKRSLELTDPILLENCLSDDVLRCIQIGLLCLQAKAVQRPTMALVVFMLTGFVDLPVPAAPAMSFPQFNMPIDYSSRQQSEITQFSTKSISQDLPPNQDNW